MADISVLFSEQQSTSLNWAKNIEGLDSEYFVYLYRDASNSNYSTVQVCKYTGSDIEYGTKVVLSSNILEFSDMVVLDDTRVMIAYNSGSTLNQSVIVGTINKLAKSISFGTPQTLSTGNLASSKVFGLAKIDDNTVHVTYSSAAIISCQQRILTITNGDDINLNTEYYLEVANRGAWVANDVNANGTRVYISTVSDAQSVDVRTYNISGTVITPGTTRQVVISNPTIDVYGCVHYIHAISDTDVVVYYTEDASGGVLDLRAGLYRWTSDASPLTLLDNTSTAINSNPIYRNAEGMWGSAKISDGIINIAYTQSTPAYYLVKMQVNEDDTLSIAADVQITGISSSVGFSSIGNFNNTNSISAVAGDTQTVATSGYEPPILLIENTVITVGENGAHKVATKTQPADNTIIALGETSGHSVNVYPSESTLITVNEGGNLAPNVGGNAENITITVGEAEGVFKPTQPAENTITLVSETSGRFVYQPQTENTIITVNEQFGFRVDVITQPADNAIIVKGEGGQRYFPIFIDGAENTIVMRGWMGNVFIPYVTEEERYNGSLSALPEIEYNKYIKVVDELPVQPQTNYSISKGWDGNIQRSPYVTEEENYKEIIK